MPTIEDLTTHLKDTRDALEEYSTEVTEKYARELPGPMDDNGKALPVPPELLVERNRAWTDEERDHLAVLRKAATQAAVQLHRARQTAGTDTPAP